MSTIRSILFVVFTLWLFLAVILQFTLLYFILRHSPRSFRIFKWLLAYSSISQLVTILSCYFNQFGIITNVKPMVIKSFGLCRCFEPRVCFFSYVIIVVSTYFSNTAIFSTFYFKFRSVKTVALRDSHVAKFMILIHVPVTTIIALKVWFYQEMVPFFDKASEDPQKYKSDEWSIFAIIDENARAFPCLNLALAIGAVWLPVFCCFLRKRILNQVNMRMQRHSAIKRSQHSTFVTGLTIQVMIPSCLYPLAYTIFYFYYLNDMTIPLVNLYNFILIGVPPLVDPIVCLYFVTPFRKTVQGWMGKSNSQIFSTSKAV
uniref:G_PROTEIN_RECEP_F1_2 domain-containing protein n=1 Tax=Caenorhabditis japonica TaxID=281687 RepID=A0A8R1DP18_CAEJA